MSGEFIVMAIVLVLLVLFAILLLRSLSEAAGIRVRKDMKKLLRAYDGIIDRKCAEIDELTARKEQLLKEITALQTPPPAPAEREGDGAAVGEAAIIPGASYRSSVMGAGYEAIRGSFRMDAAEREQLIGEVVKADEVPHRNRGDGAAQLLAALDFDTVFRISQLPAEQQLDLLDETLNDRDWTLLRDYYEQNGDVPFDVTAFWDWLKDIARLESSAVEVFCGDLQASRQEGLIYQQQICEGIQIRSGNRVYDYCIKEREIS